MSEASDSGSRQREFPKARLEHWSVGKAPVDPYQAPELVTPKLQGKCYGHPNHEDGKFVTTSMPLAKTPEGEVVTRNTIYALGEPNPEYAVMFPNPKERMLASLPTWVSV